MDNQTVKRLVMDAVEAVREDLLGLSREIHSHPELGFHEEKSAETLSLFLEKNGFTVERGLCGLPTSFKAGYGDGKPIIAILAEYDALPEIGHGCGHNIICTSAVGAGIASKLTADKLGGRVLVIGTPAEELYGGKVIMADKGAFKGIDAAMMVHPGSVDTATTQALACQTLDIEFFGKSAHAAARPDQGINALEAMLQSYTGINSLRQHIRSTARVHGIITHGGEAANVVPDYCAGSFIVRAMENDYLDELKERVLNCFKGAALATGARLEFKWGERYAPMRNNLTMARLFADNMRSLGRDILLVDPDTFFGSTDMGNVSQVVPGIHPFVAIADKDVLIHSAKFAEAAASASGEAGLIDAAKAMAMTVVDLIAGPETLAEVKKEFNQK